MPVTVKSPVTVKAALTVVVGAVIKTVSSVALEIVSPFPKVISFPVTVKSPLKDVVDEVIKTVPSVEFVIVSLFSRIKPVAPVISKLVLATIVDPLYPVELITPVEGL